MAKKFLVPLSVNGLASDPISGSEGEIYFNTITKTLKIYKNGAWEEITGGGGNDSASIIAYVDQNIDDIYDLIFEGQYTDEIDEGVTNLYFTEARALSTVLPTIASASSNTLYQANNYTDSQLSAYEVLPSQIGNAGKYLSTDGSNTSWAELDLVAGIQAASAAATASAFTYTDQQIALVENDPTLISFVRWNKVISASTSTISGLDDNSETLDYTPGIEQVFINGAFIPRDDYTATSGSSIIFNEPLNVTDVVEVLCLKAVASVTEEQLATSVDRWTKLMTASTAIISGLDDYSNTLDYSVGYITVYVNGILIDPSEYTATSASSIIFDTPVNVDDVVEVLSYRSVGYLWDFYSLLSSASAAATASANSYTDAAIASFEALPSQTGNAGKFLTTDGSTTSWDAIVLDPILYPDYIAFDTAPTLTSASPGTVSWDLGESGLATQLNTNINVILGQEIYSVVYNGEGTTLNKGEVVMVSGAQGQKPRVIRAYNTSDAGSARTFGIVAENIASGAEGIVITQGIVKNINTDSFNEGDPLYLSATPGQLTTTKPQAPNHYVWVGVVLSKNISSGRIYVKPQNGYELDEIHDVRITSIQNDDLIVYNSASSIWVNSPKQDIINTASAAAVTYLVDSAPGTLDTLNELAAALGDDENFATTVTNSIAGKLDIATASTLYLPLSSSASFYRWTKTYSGSASIISGVDDNAITLSYNAGYIQLFINGVMLEPSEYTATDGSTITVNSPVLDGEVVDIFAFLNSTSVNTYSQAQIDAKYNNLTRWKKTFGSSASVISGVDDNSLTLSYESGYESVYLNGILLTPIVDYARTSSSVITLGQAVVVDDIIEVINVEPFNIANTYTTSQADSLFEPNIQYVSASPSGPVAGTLWIDSTNSAAPALKVYNGTTWIAVSGAASESGFHPFFGAYK